MQVKLVLGEDKVVALKEEFGDDRIEILGQEEEGYYYISFEVRHDYDVMRVLHAGTKAGLDLGLHGPSGRKKLSVTVA